MSSDLYHPDTDARIGIDCHSARFYPLASITNPDMVGFAVATANVVVAFCLRMLVDWSTTTIDVGIQGCLFQVYPILLSTLLSIKRDQLSLFDANFAISLSSSPLTVYLVFASIGDLLGFKTGLYKRVKHRHPIRTSLVLVPFLWIGLSITMRLSDQAFMDSKLCEGSTFTDWLLDTGRFLLAYVNPFHTVPGLFLAPLFPCLFLLLLGRRWSLVLVDVRAYWRRTTKLWGKSLVPWVFVKCAWYTLKHKHSWCIHLFFLYLDLLWAFRIIGPASAASWRGYVLSYGQLLSLFATIPTLLSALNALARVKTSHSHVRRLIWAEVRYLITGVEQHPSIHNDLPLTHQHLPLLASPSVIPLGADEDENSGYSNCVDGAILQAVSPPEDVMAGSSDSRCTL